MRTSHELGWLAGVFDPSCHMHIKVCGNRRKDGTPYTPQISLRVQTVDSELTNRVRKVAGCGTCNRGKIRKVEIGTKRMSMWQITGEEAFQLLEKVYSHLRAKYQHAQMLLGWHLFLKLPKDVVDQQVMLKKCDFFNGIRRLNDRNSKRLTVMEPSGEFFLMDADSMNRENSRREYSI